MAAATSVPTNADVSAYHPSAGAASETGSSRLAVYHVLDATAWLAAVERWSLVSVSIAR